MIVIGRVWLSQALYLSLVHEKCGGIGLEEIHPLVFIADDQAAPIMRLGARFDLAFHAAQMLLR